MSLSFSVTSKALASLNFGAGDIALLAGAGRRVGTWLNARLSDRTLLEFLVKDEKEIIPRRGLIVIADLQKRWGQRLKLFKEGKIVDLAKEDVKNLLRNESLDLFTWTMTLLTAGLLASSSMICTNSVLSGFMSQRCIDSDGHEHMLRELSKHIEGWRSISQTRGILRVAQDEWSKLERQEMHQVGLIPDSDANELTRFILWLVDAEGRGEQNRIFWTSSTDTYSLAIVLNELGIDHLHAVTAQSDEDPLRHFPESQLVVALDQARISATPNTQPMKRRGMRINLQSPQECVSLWPGSEADNNARRSVFNLGMRASEDFTFSAAQVVRSNTAASQTDFQPLLVWRHKLAGRTTDAIYRVCQTLLIGASPDAAHALSDLFASWALSPNALNKTITALLALNEAEINARIRTEFQIFILGYYYGLLSPLLDTSRLTTAEGFGSWSWNDLEICSLIKSAPKLDRELNPNPFSHLRDSPGEKFELQFIERHNILRLVAYLFAGVDMHQLHRIRRDCCGVHGRITVMDATLLGDADSLHRISQFALLDVDRSQLPSTDGGIMRSGEQSAHSLSFIPELELQSFSAMIHTSQKSSRYSFTIEPDWDVDNTKVLVTYRRGGRIVARLSPETIYQGVFSASRITDASHRRTEDLYRYGMDFINHPGLARESRRDGHIDGTKVHSLRLESFDGGFQPIYPMIDGTEHPPLFVPTSGERLVRSCLAGLYSQETRDSVHLRRSRQIPPECTEDVLIVHLDSGIVIIQ